MADLTADIRRTTVTAERAAGMAADMAADTAGRAETAARLDVLFIAVQKIVR